MKRMWINQPSTLQPLHELHGRNVLAQKEDGNSFTMRVWFTSGDVISRQVPKHVLSDGWILSDDDTWHRNPHNDEPKVPF